MTCYLMTLTIIKVGKSVESRWTLTKKQQDIKTLSSTPGQGHNTQLNIAGHNCFDNHCKDRIFYA